MKGCGRQQLRTPDRNTSAFALMFSQLLPIPCSDGRCREGSRSDGRTAGDDTAAAVPSGITVPTVHGLLAAGCDRDAPSRGAGAPAVGQWHRPAGPERGPDAPTPPRATDTSQGDRVGSEEGCIRTPRPLPWRSPLPGAAVPAVDEEESGQRNGGRHACRFVLNTPVRRELRREAGRRGGLSVAQLVRQLVEEIVSSWGAVRLGRSVWLPSRRTPRLLRT